MSLGLLIKGKVGVEIIQDSSSHLYHLQEGMFFFQDLEKSQKFTTYLFGFALFHN